MTNRSLFDRIDQRIALDREDGDYAFFHVLMLKLEYMTKVIVSGTVACIGDDSDRHRYTLEHKLVRADSLGAWIEALNTALVGPPAQVLLPAARHLSRNLTEQVGPEDWRYDCVTALKSAASELDVTVSLGAKVALRQYFDLATQLRNRTRGHGAPTATQCSKACLALERSLISLEQNMELFAQPWVHLYRNLSGKYRVSPLLNDSSSFDYLKRTRDVRIPDGVYINLTGISDHDIHLAVPLIFADPDLLDISLPNGNYVRQQFETLSYITNEISTQDGAPWSSSPARLPPSETEGSNILELLGNTFTNVPPEPVRYVARTELETRLKRELLMLDRHPIVTLTGPGGIGKTTIALKAVHHISTQEETPYDTILWISARDIDLLDSGPKHVSRRVFTQKDVSRAVVDLLEPKGHSSKDFSADGFFQKCLAEGAAGSTLFVLDNFETLQSPADTVEWLDTHIRPPNKILITTRFRDFVGDYPIEICGMSDDEATTLVSQHSNWLGIADLLTGTYRSELVKESEGHPYVIKILLGQVAKERRAVSPKRIVAASDHLLNALFKRTYNALTPAAQRVFLLLCSWRVFVPEVAVEAVSLRPGTERFDVSHALKELVGFSLVESSTSEDDGERFVGVPLAAAVYGQRELKISPFKVAVEEDRKILMDFGAGKREDSHRGVYPRIENLVRTVAGRVSNKPDELGNALPILEYLANRFPTTYLRLADLVLEANDDTESKEQAKAYVRSFLMEAEVADRYGAWMRLARLCRLSDDPRNEIHAICEAALLPTMDQRGLGELASHLNSRIRDLKTQGIDDAWSPEVRELLVRVAGVMDRRLKELSGSECSRLAWLYLNVGNPERALDVAHVGIDTEPDNVHCQRLIERLQPQ